MLNDSFKIRYKTLPIAISTANNQYTTELHNHREFQMVLIESGKASVRILDKTFNVSEGDLVLINPMEVHRITPDENTEYRHKCVCFDCSLIMDDGIAINISEESTTVIRHIGAEEEHAQHLTDLFLKLFDVCKNEPKSFEPEVKSYVTLIFAYLTEKDLFDKNNVRKENVEFCETLLKYIHEHYAEPITSKQASEDLAFNQSYFCRAFKKNFGMSFSEYLNNYRIFTSRRMIEETNKNIADIAFECGFATPSYFAKCFKSLLGVLPAEYRKTMGRTTIKHNPAPVSGMRTQWTVGDAGKGITTMDLGDRLMFDMKTNLWTRIHLRSNTFPCEENKVYKIHIDVNGAADKIRFTVQWYSAEENNMLSYRRYVDKDDEITVPEGITQFDIIAVIGTKEDTVVTLGDISYEYAREHHRKPVKICTIGDWVVHSKEIDTQEKLIAEYEKLIDEVATKENPDLLVLTEHFHNLCNPPLPFGEWFVDIDHLSVKTVSKLAKKYNMYIGAGFHILEEGNRYNSILLFDRCGEIISRYNKTHLTMGEYLKGIVPGDGPVTIDTDIGRIGLMLSWDTWFPAFFEQYYAKQCDIIVNPTRSTKDNYQINSGAITMGAFLAASGHKLSTILDKRGNPIDEDEGKGYAVATVDLTEPAWVKWLSVGSFWGYGISAQKKSEEQIFTSKIIRRDR